MSSIAAATAAPATAKLVQLANGEYTAASVAKDPTDAAKLGLTREKDGNYGTQAATFTTAAATSSSGTQAALTTLTLGGS